MTTFQHQFTYTVNKSQIWNSLAEQAIFDASVYNLYKLLFSDHENESNM